PPIVSGGAGAIATPAVSASAGTGGCSVFLPCGGNPAPEAHAIVIYYMEVLHATGGVTATYLFDINGGITATCSSPDENPCQLPGGKVRVTLTPPGGLGLTGFDVGTTFLGVPGGEICGSDGCINGIYPITVHAGILTNTLYRIE